MDKTKGQTMKIRAILLSLATVLLLSCSATDDIQSYSLKNEAMNTETKVVSNEVAGVIQTNAAEYNCEIMETALSAGGFIRITVQGTPEDLERLFAFANESTGTETV
jgi:hypothetical protein